MVRLPSCGKLIRVCRANCVSDVRIREHAITMQTRSLMTVLVRSIVSMSQLHAALEPSGMTPWGGA